jgi:hypothetical protein
MATLNEQLDSMRRLAENWDGYGAASPQANVIDLAQEFVGLLEAVFRKSPSGATILHVSPTRIGGVLIDWEDNSREHEIEINPDRSIGFLHVNKASLFPEKVHIHTCPKST